VLIRIVAYRQNYTRIRLGDFALFFAILSLRHIDYRLAAVFSSILPHFCSLFENHRKHQNCPENKGQEWKQKDG